ncbi:MAG: phosphatidate cytidylyltransferase [bacterium]|nr:phosphatidate cytidylyltransferase [bacterium]
MFRTRLLSGIVLIVIAFAAFLAGAPLLCLLLLFISLAGYRELAKALGVSAEGKKPGAPEIVGYVGITVYYLLILAADCKWMQGNFVCYMACVIGVFLAELFAYVLTFPKYRAEQIAFAVFSFLYAPVMLSFIDFIRMEENGGYTVWFILICSWGCDTCAYCVGKLIGKKKIFPSLSPKKSLEGCIGGVAGAALLGAAYSYFIMRGEPKTVGLAALICAVGAVVSMAGDLAASAVKRNTGIKDFGKLIPGHGGIMDRFDSVIVTAPWIYFLSVLLLGQAGH